LLLAAAVLGTALLVSERIDDPAPVRAP